MPEYYAAPMSVNATLCDYITLFTARHIADHLDRDHTGAMLGLTSYSIPNGIDFIYNKVEVLISAINPLAKLSSATAALAKATSLDEIKAIRDMAEQARLYAQANKLGLDAINAGTEIRLRADRKMGEVLILAKETGEIRVGNPQLLPEGIIGLSDIGVSLKQSHVTQQLARLPETVFESRIEAAKVAGKRLTTARVAVKGQEQKAAGQRVEGEYSLHCAACDDLRLDVAVDAIITDPPYPKEYLSVYSDLGALAARVLKPGGSLFAMAGQSYLPEVMERLGEHLTYHWTLAYLTPGGQAVQLWAKNVNTFWKPVLWFTKGEYKGKWLGDVARSLPNDNDKRFHHWGQSESGMLDLIERCSEPGDLILDPFLGGGTTGIAALAAGRRFIGADVSGEVVAKTQERFQGCNTIAQMA